MTVTQRNQNTRWLPPFRRSSIRNPSAIERQMVRFSFPILCSEFLPFSLYLTNDRRTALNPAEHKSSRFYAPLYTDSPRPPSTRNSLTMEQQILSLRAFG